MQDPVKIGKNFLAVMDKAISKCCYNLADNAILDWFGLTIYGREAIKQFLLVHLEKTHHSVRKVTSIAGVSHRMLNPNQAEVHPSNSEHPLTQTPNKLEVECGQGDVKAKVTPDRPIQMNYQDMVKAPGRMAMRPHQITRRLQFVEIKAKVLAEKLSFNGTMEKSQVAVRRIVLGIDDEGDVSFVMYDGNSPLPRPRKLVFD